MSCMSDEGEHKKIESARRQHLIVKAANPSVLRGLKTKMPKTHPTALYYLAQQSDMTPEVGYRMVHSYSYDELQREVLPSYNRMKDFEAAAERLADAVQKGEQIGISGDYDCDGNCSTALMIRFLQASGVSPSHVHVHIPNRAVEGYGVNTKAVEEMAAQQPPVTFLLTLDNGTLAHKPLQVAKDKKMDAVVIDHHPNSDGHALPEGALVVNPKRSDESSAIAQDPNGAPDLAAVGVSWLIARRATEILQARGHYHAQKLETPDPRDWLGLVAMATVGDVVNIRRPLNRALVNEGLAVIREGKDPYVAALAQVARLREADIAVLKEDDIAFKLTPIINAPGRLGQSVAWAFLSPPDATCTRLDVLTQDITHNRDDLRGRLVQQKTRLAQKTDEDSRKFKVEIEKTLDKAEANTPEISPYSAIDMPQYALMLLSNEANELRKLVGASVMRQARPMAQKMLHDNPQLGTLVLAGEDWHEGVVGIVAGRIKEEFGLPTLVANINPKTGQCKASLRSINVVGHPVDVGQAVRDMCEKDGLLSKAGGHPMAAGASFSVDKVDAIRADFEQKLGDVSRGARAAQRSLLAGAVNMAQAVGDRTPLALIKDFAASQHELRPFGQGSEKPRVALYGARIENVQRSYDGQHLSFRLVPNGAPQDAITCRAFHAGNSAFDKMLRAVASDASREHIPLITGTLEASDDPTKAVTFFAEDIALIPTKEKGLHAARARTPSEDVAQYLHCRPEDLLGAFQPKGLGRKK